jgi:hypothetical protein
MSSHRLARPLLACLFAAATVPALAQQGSGAIYTCVDAKGHRLTSDRPIPECLDREQHQLDANGNLRGTLGPSLTATERAQLEEKQRRQAEERLRQADERRAEKTLLTRYPNQAAHDADRAMALRNVQDVVAAGKRRLADLMDDRKRLTVETEFYKTRAKWPAKLRRQIDECDAQIAAQQRFLAAQEEERNRINTHYDEELARLKQLWARLPQAVPAPAPAPRKP